jgi:4-hydroxybenzoate polyprenyltransferase
MNLLPFSIDNQRQGAAIEEDKINKPWRPLPSKRITIVQSTSLMLACYILALLLSIVVGGCAQCIMLIGLGYWYNDLGGADSYCLVRNFINGCGYICFISGALEVMLKRPLYACPAPVYQWLFIIGLVIVTTIHAQDFEDQEGDRARMRWTVPLVIGDLPARCTISCLVPLWSYICALFWGLHAVALLGSLCFGVIVAGRYLALRTTAEDRVSFRMYNLWVMFIFFLPVFKG